MAKQHSIHLLNCLSEYDEFHTAVFFSYGVDLAFYEEAVLYPLRRNGCRNHLVFVDAQRYNDTLADLRGSVTSVGRRYILIPVSLGSMQSFHPKLILLLGRERGRLLIGSGNLTFTGFGHNHETYTCLDWTPEKSALHDLFIQAWKLIRAVLERWGHSEAARTTLSKAEYVSDWLFHPSESATNIQLLHTLEEPLIEQCSRALAGKSVERITVLSPFLDDRAHVLSELYARFRPSELRLVLQDKRAVGKISSIESLQRTGVPLQVYRFADNDRYLHAKVYLFETAGSSYLLTGSANCTRAAWLSTPADGNVEVMLLRHADSRQYFDPLLAGRIEADAISSLDEIELQHEPVSLEGHAACVRLLDISVAGGLVSVVLQVSQLPVEVTELQLRFSMVPSRFLSLGEYATSSDSCQVPVPSDLQDALGRPLSASIWGVGSDGMPVDLGCNEMWMTNVDAIANISSAAPDVRTGSYLAAMALESEAEWRDLYESLSRLIELDVTSLKRRGGTYTASPCGSRSPGSDTEDKETEVRLLNQVAEALYHESPFYAWLQYVHDRLPGAMPEPAEREDGTGGPGTSTTSREKGHRRRWTPSERIGRSFVNLVKKYIGTLHNVEYMQTVSNYHILAYYPVFQRIVWLLYQHKVIDSDRFVQLVTDINRGFFGAPDEGPPVLCPRLQRHIQRVWRDDWQKEKVPFYALASMFLAKDPTFRTLQVSEPRDDGGVAQRIYEQSQRALCGLLSVVEVSWVSEHAEALARHVDKVYGLDGDGLAFALMDRMEHSLEDVEATLEGWGQKASAALSGNDDPALGRLVQCARADYGLARVDILAYMGDIEAQTHLCSDLVFWLRRAGDLDASRDWSNTLVDLLESQGKGHEAAWAMFRHGQALFFDKVYEDAANELRQASLLAGRLGNDKLAAWCEQFLEHTEFFLN